MVELSITKASVLTEARMTVEYVGMRVVGNEGESVYESLKAKAGSEEILGRFWDEAVAGLTLRCRPWLSWVTEEGGTTLYITLKGESAGAYDKGIEQDVRAYLVDTIVADWLLLGNVAADKVEPYSAVASALVVSIEAKLKARDVLHRQVEEAVSDSVVGDTVESHEGADSGSGGEAAGDSVVGDTVESHEGADSGSGGEAAGDSVVGDMVESHEGADSGSGGEAAGDSVVGDTVESHEGADSGSGGEAAGDSVVGDTVESHEGEAVGGGEPSASFCVGDMLPQSVGAVIVERFRL